MTIEPRFTIVTGGLNRIGAAICSHLLASGSLAVINIDKVPPVKERTDHLATPRIQEADSSDFARTKEAGACP